MNAFKNFLFSYFIIGLSLFAMPKESKIYVAGHNGLVGRALVNKLILEGYNNIITRTSKELDLRSQADVFAFFEKEKPEYVFLAAAKVGGIKANFAFPAEFIYDNLMIEANVIHASYLCNVTKLLFFGSSCIYPKLSPQPIKESYLLTSDLEKTNEAYAVAKIAGLKLCEYYNKQYGTNFISCMPTNLYGPNDHFETENSHVIPALITKIYEAKEQGRSEVIIWGTGNPRREFLHVRDLVDAALFLMNFYDGSETVNIGSGTDISIKELAYYIKNFIGFEGDLVFDVTMPDGTLQKLLDITKIKSIGWRQKIPFLEGLQETIEWYRNSQVLKEEE